MSRDFSRLRRRLLRGLLAGGALAVALSATLMRPLRALAGEWPKAAFEAVELDVALKNAGIVDAATSEDIILKAPEIAENGAQVPLEIVSRIPGSQTIYIFVDKNPQPFAGSFDFLAGAEPFIATRIKMGETSKLRVVVFAAGKYYMVAREVKVTIGGCAN